MSLGLDPFAEREAQKYSHPIPSREYIMALLGEEDQPLSYAELVEKLGLVDEEKLEALRWRLKAMQRDGQLMQNRRGAYALVQRMHLIPGKVHAHKDGYGFLIPDQEQGGEDLFLSAKEMRSLFHGDRVLAAVVGLDNKGRPEGKVVEILERNTEFLVGRYRQENGIGFVEASTKKVLQDIVIPPGKSLKAKEGQVVNVKILSQPAPKRQAVGEVVEILGEYMAPGMEINIATRAYGLPHVWPEAVEAECSVYAGQLKAPPVEEGRIDLRHLPFITIDGEDAKDFDDAICCFSEPEGGWRLYVAIADVSYYVKPGSALDQEASLRGNSVYFPGQVIPMLPEVLSNGLCSLNPQVDRLCLVCEIQIDQSGKSQHFQFYPAVIFSKARMTYTAVSKLIAQDKKLKKQYAQVVEDVDRLYQLYQVLLAARIRRGALDFESTETKIQFGRNRKIQKIVPVERTEAHRLVEEMMLAANVATAQFLQAAEIPVLYRVHGEPAPERLQELRQFLSAMGLTLTGGEKPKPADFAALLKAVEKRPDHYLIQTVILRSMNQANYHPTNIGHFGLAYEAYTHFTSPIRRYPDLLVHRAIRQVISKASIEMWPHTTATLQRLGEQCSYTERRADEAVRDVTDWLKCEFMLERVGEVFEGLITSVRNFGIFVLLTGIYVEGLVHVTSLRSDYYDYDPVHHVLLGQRSGIRYQLGDPIRVRLSRVDLELRRIDFELAR